MPECQRKVSLASTFLQVVSCLSPASAFRHQGSARYRWSLISPAMHAAMLKLDLESEKTASSFKTTWLLT